MLLKAITQDNKERLPPQQDKKNTKLVSDAKRTPKRAINSRDSKQNAVTKSTYTKDVMKEESSLMLGQEKSQRSHNLHRRIKNRSISNKEHQTKRVSMRQKNHIYKDKDLRSVPIHNEHNQEMITHKVKVLFVVRLNMQSSCYLFLLQTVSSASDV
jgi:hypothetical protein